MFCLNKNLIRSGDTFNWRKILYMHNYALLWCRNNVATIILIRIAVKSFNLWKWLLEIEITVDIICWLTLQFYKCIISQKLIINYLWRLNNISTIIFCQISSIFNFIISEKLIINYFYTAVTSLLILFFFKNWLFV